MGSQMLQRSAETCAYLGMKFSQILGIIAAVVLVWASTLNWTWYPDLQKYFTGFWSENNMYGKPGKVFVFFAVIAVIFFLIPRIWAKRWNLLVSALIMAYAIKSFILFSGCYRGICPEKQAGIWIMLASAAIILLATLLPDLAVNKRKDQTDL